ncbi:hypothetical protein PYCC9005_003868 [Savitreella phatthalungensis]
MSVVELNDLEKARPRITYADAFPSSAVAPGVPMDRDRYVSNARSTRSRRQSISGMSVVSTRSEISRVVSRRRSIDPETTLPIGFRTLSIHVEDTKEKNSSIPIASGKAKHAAVELTSLDWHRISIEEVAQRLDSSRTAGLTTETARSKLARDGKNKLTPVSKKWLQRIFWYVFGGFGSLLVTAAILTFISWKPLGQPPQESTLALAIVLLAVDVIQAVFNAYQDYSTTKTMSSITGMLPSDVVVIRDGTTVTIKAEDVVAGDLIQIRMGNKVPADLRIIECSADLKFDRAVLTGESEPIAATVGLTDENFLETKNIALQGTLVTGGSGMGIVVQTGDRTVFGRISVLSQGKKAGRTTLENEILRFVKIICCLALATCLLVIILWAAWLRRDHPDWINTPLLIVDVVSVCVAFVPEGLPMAVTVSLTIVANKMRKANILCKSLATVETLGAVNLICSDKTGTLTKNLMFVVKAAVFGDERTPEETRDQFVIARGRKEKSNAVQILHTTSSLCCTATFDAATSNLPLSERKMFGDATDCSILRFSESISPIQNVRDSWSRIFEVPFNSRNKYMLRLMQADTRDVLLSGIATGEAEKTTEQDYLLTMKGAPDVLMPRCNQVLMPDGEILQLTHERRQAIEAMQENWSSQGLRVLMFARKIVPSNSIPANASDAESSAFASHIDSVARDGLVCIGLVGIVDPPKDDIPEVVSICRGAGIRFFMVTGDFKLTAAAIARQVGIITAGEVHGIDDLDRKLHVDPSPHFAGAIVLSGPELITLNDNQWSQLCQYEEVVFARTTPEQKLRIVKEFQARDNVVGMTGDGVNDAPSLKAADIGIAMAGGSDVAIEAADMVLLADFSAIVTAIESGRLVFDNLKKTVVYLLPAGTFSELWPVLAAVILGIPQILSSFLMIVICCLTDAANSMTLALEKPEADLLSRPPRNIKKDRLADAKLILHAYGFIGIPQTLTSFAISFWYIDHVLKIPFFKVFWLSYGNYPDEYDVDAINHAISVGSSIYFANLVIMQLFNLLATRTRRLSILQQPPIILKRSRNYYLFAGMVFTFVILFIFNYIPALQSAILSADIPAFAFFTPMAFGLAILLMDESRKAFVRARPHSFAAKLAW